MDDLMGRMGDVPILSVKWSVSIGTMINFDGDRDGHGDGDGTCKQAFTARIRSLREGNIFSHVRLLTGGGASYCYTPNLFTWGNPSGSVDKRAVVLQLKGLLVFDTIPL